MSHSSACPRQRPPGPDSPAPPQAADAHPLPLRLLLAFSPAAYERRFVAHYVAFYHRYAQASLVLGLVLVLGDFLVDYLGHPGLQANLLRLQVAVPLLLLGLGYTALPAARRHWQPVLAGFIVAVAYALFWILLRIDAEGGEGLQSWVGILNFTFLEFYCFIILGVQFRFALASGLAILAAFEAAMWWHPGLPHRELAYWSYHVSTVFIMAAGLGWWREYLLRKEFAMRCALDEAREAAERLARTKSDFLASMSHEIRTPMNGVLGMNELLIDSELLPHQRAWAEAVQRSGRHLLAVINDVLDVSKIEAGHLTLEAVDFDLVEVVEDALAMFAQPAQAKGLELAARFTPPGAALALHGDPLRLRQIVANLVGNAVKFTATGEVLVHAELQAQQAGRTALRICVQDSGIGIAPEAHERIFEQFSQADSSTSRNYGGTGLGLAICRQLTDLMGGSIRVDSAPGQGARFTVELQLPPAPAPAPEAAPAGVGPDTRLLVVDDNAALREILARQLQAWGLQAEAADGQASALRLLEQAAAAGRPYALALIDAQLPLADGRSLTAEMRRRPALAATRALLLGSSRHDWQAQQALGIAGQLGKPVRRAELRRAITEALSAQAQAAAPRRAGPALDPGALHGMVLLVEDNGVNQRVAAGMLRKLGLRWQLAENGAVAVQCVRDQAFDLVLMDCQMPVMDGYQATAAIRQLPDGRGARLPIVALTAHQGPEEQRKCQDVGMNGFLTKPFTLPALRATLVRWLPPQRADAPAVAAPAPGLPVETGASGRLRSSLQEPA